MCGIFGIVSSNINPHSFTDALNTITHRGPDDSGISFTDKVALGHRRLSIIDLSNHAKQPMRSASADWEIIFNGEIYNYLSLKQELDINLKTSSDTEVLLELISKLGFESAVKKAHGMFAIAAYCKSEKKIYLARDRFGEKPLFYGKQGDHFYFSSELRPIMAYPKFKKNISEQGLRDFFGYNYIPAPKTIFEDVYKLEAGAFLEYDIISNEVVHEGRYWSQNEIVKNRMPLTLDLVENTKRLDGLLKEVIEREMISDVPLGAFLSGGVDSSLIVALMQQVSSTPVKTFTIGFDEKKYNEAIFAKDVAKHLKTDHHEMYVKPKDALSVIPKIASIYDEPMSDSSQIPTYLVSSLIRDKVTVALSGDGGDEIFGGYTRYFLAPKIKNKMDLIPSFIRNLSALGIKSVPPGLWDIITPFPGDRIHKFANVLKQSDDFSVYNRLITHWADESPVKSSYSYTKYKFDELVHSYTEKMMLLDSKTYMIDDILCKVDRAGMAVSLETRAPFLDHSVFEFAWNLPLEQKVSQGNGKIILKELLYQYVPRELIERPKMGFGVPLEHWFRNELRDWLEDLLSEKKLSKSGLLNVEIIRKKLQEHLSGKRNWQYYLWDVAVFQMWYEEYIQV